MYKRQGEITSEEAAILIEAVRKELEDDEYKFYPGVSYRHLTIWDHGEVVELVPPHDVLGQKIGQYLPKQEKLKEMMKKSFDILDHHPINEARAKRGLNKANSIWFWGAGTKPALDDFKEDVYKRQVTHRVIHIVHIHNSTKLNCG